MIKIALILYHAILATIPTSPWDDVRTWAHNHSSLVWDAPDSLWIRLEYQAKTEGYRDADHFIMAQYANEEK